MGKTVEILPYPHTLYYVYLYLILYSFSSFCMFSFSTILPTFVLREGHTDKKPGTKTFSRVLRIRLTEWF